MSAAIAMAALSAATLVVAGGTAGGAPADGPSRSGDVTPTGDGLLGRVRAQVNELNSYESHPVPCNEEEPELAGSIRDTDAGDGVVEHQGFRRWVLPGGDQDVWLDVLYDGTSGTVYALECWSPELGAIGYLYRVQLFPDINPQNLARLALDEFFLGLPAPEAHFNPQDTTLVFERTYRWVENIPSGQLASPVISVPGLSVQGFAEAGHVQWDMGDGHDPESCPATAVGSESCSYQYDWPSGDEDGLRYHGTATVVWVGSYTINGTPANQTFDIPREVNFSIAVAENAAVVTPGT